MMEEDDSVDGIFTEPGGGIYTRDSPALKPQ